jgi:uncharacterized membrane protein
MGLLPEHSSQDHAARDAAVLACLGRGVEVVAMADDALALWWLRLVLPGLGLFPEEKTTRQHVSIVLLIYILLLLH